MPAGLSREQVIERLAAHFSAKFGGTVWATYDPTRRAYEIRGERLPAAPEMRETYPNGWSLLDHLTPRDARAIACADQTPGVVTGDQTLRPIGTRGLIPCAEHSRAAGRMLQHRYEVVADPDQPTTSPVHVWTCVDPTPDQTRLSESEDYVLAAEKAGAEMCGLVVTVAIQNDAFAEDTYGECARILRELADQLDRAEDFTCWRRILDANGNEAGCARIA